MSARLDHLRPIDLAGLEEGAALQTRRDRKYVVPVGDVDRIVDAVSRGDTRVLEIGARRAFRYESCYLDTPELVSYLDAARRRRRRFKVRTRRYLDDGATFLELKTRDVRGFTAKHRIATDVHGGLTAEGRRFLRSLSAIPVDPRRLEPTLRTRYRRVTLLGAGTARMTIDTDLHWSAPGGGRLAVPDIAIVETKSVGPPTVFDRRLWECGHRPTKISKYGTGLAALHPALPANKWHRVLAAHFGRIGPARDRALLDLTPLSGRSQETLREHLHDR